MNSKELLTKEDFGSNCIDQFYYEEDNKNICLSVVLMVFM